MQDASPHAIIQSFISGLSDFLSTLIAPGQREAAQRAVYMFASSSSKQKYAISADCYFRGGTIQGTACFLLIGDGSTYNGVRVAGSKEGVVLLLPYTAPAFFQFTRVFLKAGTILTLDNTSASTVDCTFFLENA